MRLSFLAMSMLLWAGLAMGMNISISSASVRAPVVHSGQYHILSCGMTHIVLDGSKGMSVAIDSEEKSASQLPKSPGEQWTAFIRQMSLRVELERRGQRILLDQAFDSVPRLQIISQGSTHVAARAFFRMMSFEGKAFGTGTLDIYVYSQRVHLVPSIFIDHVDGETRISRAGFFALPPEDMGRLEVQGKTVEPQEGKHFQSFGSETEDFHLTLSNPSGRSARIGWLRNAYPSFVYLREVDQNPETDDLYERWPPWISQRGPLAWKIHPSSGLEADFSSSRPETLDLLWVGEGPLDIPQGGYRALNGVLAVFLGQSREEVDHLWADFKSPLKPAVTKGDFRFYNEVEGIYEWDSQGGDVDLTFDCSHEKIDRTFGLRIWNLKGKNACRIALDGRPIPVSLMNDEGFVEDPMVFIVKEGSGPANLAFAVFTVAKGKKVRLTMERMPGLQFTYQMYSELETYEAWSDQCADQPLFRFYLKNGEIYEARLPGRKDYSFFKLPLYWMKNGVNPSTFLNHVKGFTIDENGPRDIQISITGTNSDGTGLSTYAFRVPYEGGRLSFHISAEFEPRDDGRRWTSLEYCDLYPFDGVSRRNFHYKSVIYLSREGVFERVGAGAWDHRFVTREEPERLGYYSEYLPRTGPGSRVPHPQDGTVWILGDNPERGNILYRLGDRHVSEGIKPAFSLCNAWMDIHNQLVERKPSLARERINYVIEIFPGALPAVEELNALYLKASGGEQRVMTIATVLYSREGKILGFEVK